MNADFKDLLGSKMLHCGTVMAFGGELRISPLGGKPVNT